MPAAAVIPAPLAYTIIVAVKRLVVGLNTFIFLVYKKNTQTHTLYIITHFFFFQLRKKKNKSTKEFIFLFQHCEQIRVYQTCRF